VHAECKIHIPDGIRTYRSTSLHTMHMARAALFFISAFVGSAVAPTSSVMETKGAKKGMGSHGFDENPVKTIGVDACSWVLAGGACSEFTAKNRVRARRSRHARVNP
jgi:hypothetical protein